MDDRRALDQLLETARELCSSSKEHGVDTRSALAGGALGMLLSSRHGRTLVGKVIKYGAVAGLGALAYQASRERERDSALHPERTPGPAPTGADSGTGPQATPRSDASDSPFP